MDKIAFSFAAFDFRKALVALLLAFGLSQAIAGTYLMTYRGLSYARSTVQGLAMGAIVPCMLMIAIGQNVAAGLGVAGGLALIRFRTSMRDPRDIVFIFASLGVGIACGAHAYGAAVGGSLLFCVGSFVLHFTGYGTRQDFDGLVRFTSKVGTGSETAIEKALRGHCRTFALVTLREVAQGGAMEHAYQISLGDPEQRTKLVKSLQSVGGVSDVTLLMQEPTLDL
ncbi:MAG: DUF4956 domain-containing protein [Polyangiaceae bacterium]